MTTYSSQSKFQQPVLQYEPGKEFVLVEDYVFTWVSSGITKMLWIPAGFNYDKASVPKFAWGRFRPDGPVEAAALIHDRLYMFKGKLPAGEYQVFINREWRNDPSPWTRAQADDLLEMMGILGGMSKKDAAIYKWAVKLYPPNFFKSF